jgi:prophage antirepressor-like protein
MDDQNSQAAGAETDGMPLEFKFDDRVVRTLAKDGEPWFVAADVCRVLEHTSPSVAVEPLDEDEKRLSNVYTNAGTRNMLTINESGLYNLVFTSRMPKAREFRRWVTHEVLPAIRKTGRYETEQADAAAQIDPFRDGVDVHLPHPGRYTVTVSLDGQAHIYRNEFASLRKESNEADFALLCHTLKSIEALWQKLQHLNSLRIDPSAGFSLNTLNSTILRGAQTADHFLGAAAFRKWDAT